MIALVLTLKFFSLNFFSDVQNHRKQGMVKKIYYCANHPDIVATDTCYQCKKRICYNCKINAFGLIFCSAQCLAVYSAMGLTRIVFTLLRGLIMGLTWPFRAVTKGTARGWAVAILGLGLLTSFFFIWKLTEDVQSLEQNLRDKMLLEGVIDTTQIAPPTILKPTDSGMVTSTTLDIVGEAEGDRIVSLSIDGKLIQALVPKEGTFAFNDVRLRRSVNRIEIQAIGKDGRTSPLQTLTVTHGPPSLTYLARDFRRGSLTKKEVAITFDGGSINNAADEILDVLKDREVQSTFFLTGEFIRQYPQTVKRIASEGHEVGNHTWSHPHLTSFAQNRRQATLPGITDQTMASEFEKTASLYGLVTSTKMVPFWRAPYGEYNPEILRMAARAGYKHVGWTVGRGWDETMDTLDWVADKNSNAYYSADEITDKILNYGNGRTNGSNGVIILMHLGTHRQDDFPHKKLPQIIDGLREMGYKLVKVSEMTME